MKDGRRQFLFCKLAHRAPLSDILWYAGLFDKSVPLPRFSGDALKNHAKGQDRGLFVSQQLVAIVHLHEQAADFAILVVDLLLEAFRLLLLLLKA